MTEPLFEPSPLEKHSALETNVSPLLKLLLEIGPLCVFFFGNYKGKWLIDHIGLFHSFDKPIFPATALFIVATVLALIFSWYKAKTLPIMPLISGIFVVFFGFLTLWLHNDMFIKMKPTIVNSLFALILFVGLFFKKPLLAYVFDSALELDGAGWTKLTWRWAWFFVFLAVINEIVWRNFSNNFWANFKVFCVMPITILFFFAQLPLIMRHMILPEEDHHKNSVKKEG